jgi:hypothetical protein
MDAAKQQRCPTCGATMEYKVKTDTIVWHDLKKDVDVEAWWCECGEAIFDGRSWAIRHAVYDELRARESEQSASNGTSGRVKEIVPDPSTP